MAKSTDIKVKLSSVDEVKQFVDVMRGYHGDVDISGRIRTGISHKDREE